MIIGIDPGLHGAVAVIDGSRVLLLQDLPVVQFSQGRTKYRIEPVQLADMLAMFADASLAVVEAVSSRPGEGVSSAFSFGYTSGVICGVLGTLKIPIQRPMPFHWKKAMKLGSDKDLIRARAIELFPSVADLLKLKKHHDRAEALLMAAWGQQCKS